MKAYLSVYGKIEVVGDGDKLCAHYSDFVNLQKSPVGFGDTDAEAIGDLADELKRENTRLHEIVDKMPKTAGGLAKLDFEICTCMKRSGSRTYTYPSCGRGKVR